MLIQTFPPRRMCRVIAIRADSICRFVTYAGSSAWMPNSPNVTAVPPLAAPLRPGWCCLRCLTLRGMSISSALLGGRGVRVRSVRVRSVTGRGVGDRSVGAGRRVQRRTDLVRRQRLVAGGGGATGRLARVDGGHLLGRGVGDVGRPRLGGVGGFRR